MTTMTFAPTLERRSLEPARTQRPPLTKRGLSMVQLHDELWRVTRIDGEVVGYVERFRVPEGLRYRAKRFLPRQRRFIGVGEFWSIDDAVDCFG